MLCYLLFESRVSWNYPVLGSKSEEVKNRSRIRIIMVFIEN